jgi:hypothetical protein
VLDLELKASLQELGDGDAKTAGIQVGQTAAQNILAARANDGSGNMVAYTPGTDPGNWQPTPPAYLPAAVPQWATVTPFCLQSPSQFRPPPPPALTSSDYTDALISPRTWAPWIAAAARRTRPRPPSSGMGLSHPIAPRSACGTSLLSRWRSLR